MKKKKKPNPKNQPATQADVKRAKRQARDEAICLVVYMVLYIFIDKHNASKEEIQQLGHEINDLADSISKGYLKWQDIKKMLEEEYEYTWDGWG